MYGVFGRWPLVALLAAAGCGLRDGAQGMENRNSKDGDEVYTSTFRRAEDSAGGSSGSHVGPGDPIVPGGREGSGDSGAQGAPSGGPDASGDPSGTGGPAIPADRLLWQSTAWSNGRVRTLTAAHSFDPDDNKVELAAGEDRKLTFHGDGTITLEGNRSRIYIHGNHRDAELIFEANATDTKLENISTKLRSRHNEDGAPENRFGGYGVAFDFKSQEASFQIELYHNEHEGGKGHKLGRAIEYNKWHRYRVTIESVEGDAKAVVRAFIDYDLNGQWVEVGSETYTRTGYLKNDLNALYCWIRANSGNATQTGLKLRNALFATLPVR